MKRKHSFPISGEDPSPYRSIFDNICIGVFRTTPAGQIVAINPAVACMMGYDSVEDLMTHSTPEFYADPSARQLFLDHLQDHQDKRPFDIQLKRRDGSLIWCAVTAAPGYDKNGQLQYIDGTIEDVTDRRQAEEKLRQQNHYMQCLQDVMLAVVSRLEPWDVLETVLNRTIELMKTVHGFFYIYDEKADALVLKVGSGIYSENVGFPLRKGEGLAGKVWDTETPLVVNDYQRWSGRHPNPLWDSVYSAAGVPLKSKDRFLGVIGYLHAEDGRHIQTHEFEILNRFAELASIVLDNAQLVSRLEAELTERRRIEEELIQSEDRYRNMVEDMTEFVLRWKPDGRIIFANEIYCRYKNRSKSQVIGSNVVTLFSQTAYDQALEMMSRLTPQNPLESNDIATLGPDKQPIWEEWTDHGIFDDKGNLIEIQSIGRNITERKMAEKALRESEYRFRSFFNSSPDGIILVDLNGNVLDANQSLLKFAGMRIDELRGKEYRDLTHPKFHPQIARRIERLQAGLIEDDALEVDFLRQDGSSVPVAVRGWVITGEDSTPVALGGFIRDISHEKSLVSDKAALERQLQQTQKMEAIGTLAGGIAHDFNNILSGIIGYAELALTEKTDPDSNLQYYLSRVLDAGQRAKSLVQQILQFSRKDDAVLAPLAVTPLIKEAVKLLRSTLPAMIDIRQNLSAKPDTVVADATQLHQVVMNLCTNAYHAMRDTGGTLTVALESIQLVRPKFFLTLDIPPGPYLKLSVSDTGPGIPPTHLDRIFEPYFTTKEKHEGTGLGLSVTFGIIKNLNGLIEIERTSPQTTTFAVYLPLQKEARSDVKAAEPDLPAGSNQRLLCVDDESVFLEVMQKLLERLGYRVTTYRSSLRALECLKADPHAFDLVITDQMMPEMTGIQLVKEIQKLKSSLPIILCTGYGETMTSASAQKFGISGFLMKPVTRKELAQTVNRVLENRKT